MSNKKLIFDESFTESLLKLELTEEEQIELYKEIQKLVDSHQLPEAAEFILSVKTAGEMEELLQELNPGFDASDLFDDEDEDDPTLH